MVNDEVRSWKAEGTETPGDTNGADIVSRTGEEMPETAHDELDEVAPRVPNPSHGTRKNPAEQPRGWGDGELQEQPASIDEARQPGPDDSTADQ